MYINDINIYMMHINKIKYNFYKNINKQNKI